MERPRQDPPGSGNGSGSAGSGAAGGGAPPRAPAAADPLAGLRTVLLAIVAVILTGLALRLMKPVLVPVCLALFITLVVSPVERRIADLVPRHMRWPGIAAAMLVILAAFSVFVAAFWIGARRVAGALRGVPKRIDELIRDWEMSERTLLGQDIESLVSLIGDRGVSFVSSLASQVLNQVTATILTLAVTLFLTLLMLTEAPRAVRKLQAVSDEADSSRWRGAVRQIARKLRAYLLARAGLGALTATCYALYLWACGLDLVLVWALMTFLFSFVPNLGSVVSALLPVSYAALTGDGAPVWAIFLGLLAIEQVIGNFVDPHVQGAQVSLAPVVILVSVLFFGWLWGGLGAILGVPVTIALTVAMANVAPLRGVALFLSDRSTYADLDAVCLEPPGAAPGAEAEADSRA